LDLGPIPEEDDDRCGVKKARARSFLVPDLVVLGFGGLPPARKFFPLIALMAWSCTHSAPL
jgi:hypothetical protein